MIGKILSRIIVCCSAAILGASPLLAVDAEHPTATFRVSQPTAIPGKVLSPGTYSIHVVDSLSDRFILRVEGQNHQDRTLFIGVVAKGVPADAKGEINWSKPANDATYIRGWNFPTLAGPLEFAYPKNDAVAVAKANDAHVPAIDPESEGMVSRASLSQDEMQIITLWLLSPTTVGPQDKGGIKAERFQQVASLGHKPVVARLPHTASSLPWLWLIGVMSFTGALTLRSRRLAVARQK